MLFHLFKFDVAVFILFLNFLNNLSLCCLVFMLLKETANSPTAAGNTDAMSVINYS